MYTIGSSICLNPFTLHESLLHCRMPIQLDRKSWIYNLISFHTSLVLNGQNRQKSTKKQRLYFLKIDFEIESPFTTFQNSQTLVYDCNRDKPKYEAAARNANQLFFIC